MLERFAIVHSSPWMLFREEGLCLLNDERPRPPLAIAQAPTGPRLAKACSGGPFQ